MLLQGQVAPNGRLPSLSGFLRVRRFVTQCSRMEGPWLGFPSTLPGPLNPQPDDVFVVAKWACILPGFARIRRDADCAHEPMRPLLAHSTSPAQRAPRVRRRMTSTCVTVAPRLGLLGNHESTFSIRCSAFGRAVLEPTSFCDAT